MFLSLWVQYHINWTIQRGIFPESRSNEFSSFQWLKSCCWIFFHIWIILVSHSFILPGVPQYLLVFLHCISCLYYHHFMFLLLFSILSNSTPPPPLVISHLYLLFLSTSLNWFPYSVGEDSSQVDSYQNEWKETLYLGNSRPGQTSTSCYKESKCYKRHTFFGKFFFFYF
jgi:hypothetical protein